MTQPFVSQWPFWRSSGWWFGSTFGLFYLYLHYCASGTTEFQYDAQAYWNQAYQLSEGHLLGERVHGSSLALLYYPAVLMVRHAGLTDTEVVQLMGAAMAALLFGVVAPALWQTVVVGSSLSGYRRGIFVGLGFLFWRDYFRFPLSDFPGLLALLGALLTASRSHRRLPGLGWVLTSGVLLALAVNLRPIYLLAVPAVVGVVLWHRTAVVSRRALVISLLVLFSGFSVASLPQLLLNIDRFHSYSPLVDGGGLLLWQLNKGLVIQKYETNVGTGYPVAQVIFRDVAGQALLSHDSLLVIPSRRAYLLFAMRHPVDMIALYARHLFNGLDVQYTSPYIVLVQQSTVGLALVNYTLQFGCLLLLFSRRAGNRLTTTQGLCLLAVLLPCVLVAPFAMECRFLLALHVLLYAVLCFGWPAGGPWVSLAPPVRWRLVSAYVLYMLLCLALSSATQATLVGQPKLFQP
ncbi:hypothetical protein [Hymenobacter cavernae]|uniref:Glycosyltransferase RgtA/B/C/D-like domain-containing protein n=1 Tax=Hymenobacter cavernae TaxID=2044852 RepID=A0ABQ1UVK7_9BACT|nr:hypothetical protein [Hymenobacter cavernae]GGF27968.1 hypothetical protein GCM10011383_44610 [Hymenobacter cavernae]